MRELKMPSIKGHAGSLHAQGVTLISLWNTCIPSSFACAPANPQWIRWSPLRRRPVCDGKEPWLLKAPLSTRWEVLFLKQAVRVHAIRQGGWLRHSGRRLAAHYARGRWPTPIATAQEEKCGMTCGGSSRLGLDHCVKWPVQKTSMLAHG